MQNEKDFLLSTTSLLDGKRIEAYLGVVRSKRIFLHKTLVPLLLPGQLDKELRAVENEVLRDLKKRAKKLGGNGVVGVKLDCKFIKLNNIIQPSSNKEDTMIIMVFAYGTAVQYVDL